MNEPRSEKTRRYWLVATVVMMWIGVSAGACTSRQITLSPDAALSEASATAIDPTIEAVVATALASAIPDYECLQVQVIIVRNDEIERVVVITVEPETTPPSVSVVTSPASTTVPTATPTATPVPSPTPIIHTVREGEGLFRIGQCYGVSVEALRAVNIIGDDYKVYIGQQLVIPTDNALAPVEISECQPTSNVTIQTLTVTQLRITKVELLASPPGTVLYDVYWQSSIPDVTRYRFEVSVTGEDNDWDKDVASAEFGPQNQQIGLNLYPNHPYRYIRIVAIDGQRLIYSERHPLGSRPGTWRDHYA